MTNFMELDDLESMEQKLEDILQKQTPIVSSEQIGILAAKKKPLRLGSEVKAIERQIKTKCHCHHLEGHVIGGICYFGRCRHAIHAHPEGVALA